MSYSTRGRYASPYRTVCDAFSREEYPPPRNRNDRRDSLLLPDGRKYLDRHDVRGEEARSIALSPLPTSASIYQRYDENYRVLENYDQNSARYSSTKSFHRPPRDLSDSRSMMIYNERNRSRSLSPVRNRDNLRPSGSNLRGYRGRDASPMYDTRDHRPSFCAPYHNDRNKTRRSHVSVENRKRFTDNRHDFSIVGRRDCDDMGSVRYTDGFDDRGDYEPVDRTGTGSSEYRVHRALNDYDSQELRDARDYKGRSGIDEKGHVGRRRFEERDYGERQYARRNYDSGERQGVEDYYDRSIMVDRSHTNNSRYFRESEFDDWSRMENSEGGKRGTFHDGMLPPVVYTE